MIGSNNGSSLAVKKEYLRSRRSLFARFQKGVQIAHVDSSVPSWLLNLAYSATFPSCGIGRNDSPIGSSYESSFIVKQSFARKMETEAGKENDKQQIIFRDIRRYYCEHCGICRSKKSLLRSHILSHHKEELQMVKLDEVSAFKPASQKVQHACEECGASFWKPAHLAQHMKSHSVEEQFLQAFGFFIVIRPNRTVKTSVEALDPMMNSKMQKGGIFFLIGLRPFACPVKDCYFSYRRKDHLNRHLLKHEGKVFDCPVQGCNRAFAFQGNLKRHLKEIHDDDSPCEAEKRHTCEEPGCGKIFKSIKIPTVEFLEIFCGEPLCMKPFTNSECLKAHIQSCHKYVKCEVCGAQQLRKNFKRHQRTHEGVISKERIKCSFQGCEQSFSKKSNLNKHVKAVHEELRPFRCRTSGCQQRFPYKHVRDNHEKTHVYVQGDFFEADEQWRSRSRGGRKRERITIEALTRKRVVPLDKSSIMENGADYLRWLLADDE
ncbi:hypothetical protein M5K25_023446 [Dendrobium thyrsiflorum]|uniref:C2H2-type domain-containing protein n=1 Tax=Dendrobium thyrsiflorum TaxID=117978 RepID=A0ABD0UEX6_DENTH